MIIYDPKKKLHFLKLYMFNRIDAMPKSFPSFSRWMHVNFPQYVYGTSQYLRDLSTHCYYCHKPLQPKGEFKPTIDHFFPKSLMKLGKIESVNPEVISCHRCNNKKGSKHPYQFLREFTVSEMTDSAIPGFTKREIKHIGRRAGFIFQDIEQGKSRRVYFCCLDQNKLPKGFINLNPAKPGSSRTAKRRALRNKNRRP